MVRRHELAFPGPRSRACLTARLSPRDLHRLRAAALIAAAIGAGAIADANAAPPRPTGAPAPAQPAGAPAPDPDPPPPPSPEELQKAEAREHFEKGVALFNREAWDASLAEFLRSRQLFATRNATSNAAVCLRNLGRSDEALEMYEALLREFPEMPADLQTEAKHAVNDLRTVVGTIDVQGAEADAGIIIDGLSRGEYPSLSPLRVPAGSHTVRVYKEGFEPFETRVEVAGGQTVPAVARLRALTQPGRLRVADSADRKLAVIVDGNVVGATPWEGPLAAGLHTVVLRGDDDLGTQPAVARVQRDALTTLSLSAEPLAAGLRVKPTPADAEVSIDSVTVGAGVWRGRLRAGKHEVGVAADGFRAEVRQIELARGERQVLEVALARDPSSPLWRKPPRFIAEATLAVPLAPSLGGDLIDGCDGGCSRRLGVGAYGVFRGGYELGSGFSFGVAAGYLTVSQSTTGRRTSLQPTGLAPDQGTADDDLTIRGFVAGAFGGLALGERWPIRLRLGAGAVIGSIGDSRTGRFTTNGGAAFDVGPVAVAPSAAFLYVDPELRVGYRVTSRIELSAGIEALFLVGLSRPTWDAARAINAAGDGSGTFAAEKLAGAIVVLIAPGIGARYDF